MEEFAVKSSSQISSTSCPSSLKTSATLLKIAASFAPELGEKRALRLIPNICIS
jgi:hypothetical protein